MKDELSNNEYREQNENMKKLVSLGYPAYGKAFERTNRLDKLHDLFEIENQLSMWPNYCNA